MITVILNSLRVKGRGKRRMRSLGSAVVGRCGEGARAEKDDMCEVCDACDAAEADRNDASCLT